MTRARTLRKELGWSQKEVGEYLGCDQATVSRIENGFEPSGPISRLIDALERDLRSGAITPKARGKAPAEEERAA